MFAMASGTRFCSLRWLVASVAFAYQLAASAIMDATLAASFRVRGWKWRKSVLKRVLKDLAAEGIDHPDLLRGAQLSDIPAASEWGVDVRTFVDCLTKVPCLFCLSQLSFA